MATPPPTSPPPRPMSGLARPLRSNSRMSTNSKARSKSSDEDAKTSVKVAVRVRPSLQPDEPGFGLIPQRFQRSLVHVTSQTNLAVDAQQGRKLFVFDRVFGPEVPQDGVWEYISESTSAFIQGYNVSVMAYGQSGAGKSFTMGTSGPDEQNDRQLMGIVPRAAAKLFEHLNAGSASARPTSSIRQPNRFSMSQVPAPSHTRSNLSTDKTWQMKATYVEIYNEQLRDLLLPENTPANEKATVTIREDTKGRILLAGLTSVNINSIDDLLKALNFGSAIRQTDATTINAKSSRSHAVFSVNLIQKRTKELPSRLKRMSVPAESKFAEESITVDSKLHFVDLAGSERMKNTGASGDRAKEGISINAGLASLGKVISQLSARQTSGHISYRDSKLTRLLQDSIGGNAVTYLIACVNPAEFHLSETLNTVQYAQRARNIQSKPTIQQISDEGDRQALIERLRAEISFLRDQLRSAQSAGGHPDNADRSERSNEKEIELQNQLLDMQEVHQALQQRHAKVVADIVKAQNDDPALMNFGATETAVERLRRANQFSDIAETFALDCEENIQHLENNLNKTRATLAATESKLLERESKCTYTETVNEQLQTRLQNLMNREASREEYVRDLESNMDSRISGEERSAATIAELRRELSRLREKDSNSEEYITSLEERLAEITQSTDLLQSDIARLEHVIERQRSVGRLDNLLSELDQRQGMTALNDRKLASEAIDHVVTTDAQPRDFDSETYRLAYQTPLPEPENEYEELKDPSTTQTASAIEEQSVFMEEKLESVNQELFDLRVEHESTINDFHQLSSQYEEMKRAMALLQESKGAGHETPQVPALKSDAGMKKHKKAGQVSSSRSLSLELSSAGEHPGSLELSEASVQGVDTPYTDDTSHYSDESDDDKPRAVEMPNGHTATDGGIYTEELEELAAHRDAELRRLQNLYEELNEKYVDRQDEIEELKAEVTKAKMSNPPSPTNQFLRRKSSQNVMSIDRAHRSLASLGNIASENFADSPDLKNQFDLHFNAVMHELHQRSERVSVLEGEVVNLKKDSDAKTTMISGLHRERSSVIVQSPGDAPMLGALRDQLLQNEAQLRKLHGDTATREKQFTEELESLQTARDESSAREKQMSDELFSLQTTRDDYAAREKQLTKELDSLVTLHDEAATREKQLTDELESLKKTLEISAAENAAAANAQANAAAQQKENLETKINQMQRDIADWEQKYTASSAALAKSEGEFRSALTELQQNHATSQEQVAAATRQQREETETRFAELSTKYNDQVTKLRGEIEDLEETVLEQKVNPKNEAEKALIEARAKLDDLSSSTEEISQELVQVREKEQRASRLVEELEGQLASQFDEGQQATSRLSLMQTTRDKELAEARAATIKAQEEVTVLNKRLSQLEPHRGSVQGVSMDQPTVRKTNSVQSLPSPPPAIPLPPLPKEASHPNAENNTATSQRIEEQENRIRTIEKHLFAEKQLTATLEEALSDIEKDSKKQKADLETWKKKCWSHEDELSTLREERKSNRDSLQAVETEKARRLKAESAQAALEERMALLNKKKKKSTLNCF